MDFTAIASETARALLQIGAVRYDPRQPVFFTSGWASPVYIECRRLISYPALRRRLIDMALLRLERDLRQWPVEVVAGGDSAGIPFAAWIAERLNLPMVYIRKRPVGLGPMAQIEGDFAPGARVLLVEDLTTDARSKVNFCTALRQAGASVKHVFVVFSYGIFPGVPALLRENGLNLTALADWQDILRVAQQDGSLDGASLQGISDFLADPAGWSTAHGGIDRLPRFDQIPAS